ncbi:MAG: PEP-CTERM sorting domain-containing protein [Bryobacterales bacterium]|nr:PEP-CTERM sorting domain-containing protein [Bryobacterales bacterium]
MMHKRFAHWAQVTLAVCLLTGLASLHASTIVDVSINGTHAIFLAGRTDITIPDPGDPWNSPAGGFLTRHLNPTPEEAKEEFPPVVAVTAGDVIRVLDPAVGGINFFNGFGPPFFGPAGNGVSGSNLNSLGGISGYQGPQGALVGVFLDNDVPLAGPPATLNFDPAGLGTDFTSLTPLLGQIFYIGTGVTSGGDFRQYIAPTGATRLFLGIPDGFGFVGAPGAYDDNDGSYRVRLGINAIPNNEIPEPGTLLSVLGGLGLVFFLRRRVTA